MTKFDTLDQKKKAVAHLLSDPHAKVYIEKNNELYEEEGTLTVTEYIRANGGFEDFEEAAADLDKFYKDNAEELKIPENRELLENAKILIKASSNQPGFMDHAAESFKH